MEGRGAAGSRNILQRVGAAPNLVSKEDSDSEEELDSVKSPENSAIKMNMKQEGPFLVPQLWKDNLNNLNLDNLTNDFLESNVTGEVMNLDDFLKELQVNELQQQNEDLQRQGSLGGLGPGAGGQNHPQNALRMQGPGGNMQQHMDDRFQNLIRPTNIENLKEQCNVPMSRPSIMHHVGKPPDLNIKYNSGDSSAHAHSHAPSLPPVSLPYREQTQQQNNLLNSQKESGSQLHNMIGQGHPAHHGHHPHLGQVPGGGAGAGGGGGGGGGGIPQASVRPLVRPVIMNSDKHQDLHDNDVKPPISKRKRKISECSNMTDEDDGIGSFTSTVCVNFSEDDLRLPTIPGQDFDPATRRFSEEELKPQPIIRKRKKQFVPDELKNNKYWAKRYKNNEAAKRSREARRLKENQIAMRARYLEEENTALKGEVDVLKKENSDLKQMMMALEEKLNQMSNNR